MSYGVGKWLGSGHVGASSSALAAAMLGYVPEGAPAYPHDGSDFGRCAELWRMVEREEAQSGLVNLAAVSGPWNRLAEEWHRLLQLYDTDRNLCHDLVRRCVSVDPGMYRVSKGRGWPLG